MELPFNLRIGQVALQILPTELNADEPISEDRSWTEISTSWTFVKEFADKFIEEHESQHLVIINTPSIWLIG